MQSKRYPSLAPRIAAASMSIVAAMITMCAMVVLPAELEAGDLRGEDMNTTSHKGSCFCGAVEVTVTGDAVAAGYCHCESCRSWSAGPVNAFTLWKPSAVTVTKGEGNIGVYHKTEKSHRKFCKLCGGHLLTDHPLWGVVDVYAATIPTYPYEPALHVNYAETVLRIKDGLPKMKDMPKEMGGSGITLPE